MPEGEVKISGVDVKTLVERARSCQRVKMRELEELLQEETNSRKKSRVVPDTVFGSSTRFRPDGMCSTESKVELGITNSSFASTRNYSSSSPASFHDRSKCERFRSHLRYKREEQAWPGWSHSL